MKCSGDCLNCEYPDCICECDIGEDEAEARDQRLIHERIETVVQSAKTVVEERKKSNYRKRGSLDLPEEIVVARRKEYYQTHREERVAYQRRYDKATSRERYQREKEKRKKASSEYYHNRMQDPEFREKERLRAKERYLRKKEKQWD